MTVVLTGKKLKVEDIERVARGKEKVKIHPAAEKRINKCRLMLEEKIKAREVMYGVTTGIGEFSEVVLTPEQTKKYQKYLIYSHAAGYGDPIPEDAVRGSITSRINVLSNGLSGIRLKIVKTLTAMLNRGVTPVMCQKGSVGASGDLSPMGQMALVPMGEGEAFYKGKRMSGAAAMKKAGIPIITYRERDGLATINGSNVVTSMGSLQICDAERWLKTHDIAAAMTMEALNVNMKCCDARLHKARGFPGAIDCAENLRRITKGSKLLERKGKKVQDAYSLRSTPQVSGASKDALKYTRSMFEIELNGVGDNPLFFPDDKVVLTGANFQGTPMAFGLETLGIAITTTAVLSERRLNRLMNPALSAGLPGFLTKGGGMFSGLMLTQYTAGSLCCENRILAAPAATGSISAAADQEDFVSMAMTTAIKTRQIIDNAYAILGIELMAAAQAFEFRKPVKPSKASAKVLQIIRKYVKKLEEDRPLFDDVNGMAQLVRSCEILDEVEKITGPLK